MFGIVFLEEVFLGDFRVRGVFVWFIRGNLFFLIGVAVLRGEVIRYCSLYSKISLFNIKRGFFLFLFGEFLG